MGLASLISKKQPAVASEHVRGAKPVRNPIVTESVADGRTVLVGPAKLKGALGKLIARTSKEPVMKQYELEEVGAFVWSLIDGNRSFTSLAKELQSKYKMNRLEAEASLSAFLKMLADRGLITLMVKK